MPSTEAKAAVKWSFEADYIQACNCDYGCPCEFEAPPTHGFCQGVGAYRIVRGHFGDVPLDGLGLGFVIDFPGPMHLGKGSGGWIIDARADARQRDALAAIASGQAGGMPFEVLSQLITRKMPQHVAEFEFEITGPQNGRARFGNLLSTCVEPIRNPVTGQPEQVRVEHATGFIFRSAEVVSGRECRAATPAITFSWPGKAAFVSRVSYGN